MTTNFNNPYGYTGEWYRGYIDLLYLRARWYAPETGTFLSVDPVESEPPYLYVRGNPVNWVDPSGMLAICFQGAPGSMDPDLNVKSSELTELFQMCNTLNQDGLFDHGKIDEIKMLNNKKSDIWVAAGEIREAKKKNENEPITIIGYSYGGAAALELVWYLAFDVPPRPGVRIMTCGERFIIDNLITIDPVPFARSTIRFMNTPLEVPSNVNRALNLYAPLGTFFNQSIQTPAKLANGESGIRWLPRFGTGLYLDGTDHIEGATNTGILGADHMMIMNIDYYKENGSRVNPITETRIRAFLNGKY